jgi:Zn-dependent peptidase ImmA (M78 family)
MTRWAQQFGDTARFAVRLALSDDPTPAHGLAEAVRGSWGSFELWAGSRCLTRSARDGGPAAEGVTWYLDGLLRWLERSGPALLNEEPFPALLASDELRDAVDWLLASEDGPVTSPTAEEYERWFERRSAWRDRHSLRAALPGVAMPQVLIRRVENRVELSWDNERWPAARKDLRFVESRGSVTVEGSEVASVLARAAHALREQLPDAAQAIASSAPLWGWLVPHEVREEITSSPRSHPLRDRLDEHCASAARDSFCPHSLETWLLRDFVGDPRAASRVSDTLRTPRGKIGHALSAARTPSTPSAVEPWADGYEVALRFRDQMGWDEVSPPPSLATFATQSGVPVTRGVYVGGVADGALLCTSDDEAALLLPGQPWRASEQMAVAQGLGHLLLDAERGADSIHLDSPRSWWPALARARAFAAMLLMPDAGVREMVTAHGRVDAELVAHLCARYGVSATSATWHLRNLRIISDEARVELAAQR